MLVGIEGQVGCLDRVGWEVGVAGGWSALRGPKGSVTYCTDSKESLQFLELGMKMIFGDLYVF